jgi:transposase-like protein
MQINKVFLFIILLSLSTKSFSQSKSTLNDIVKVTFLNPGVSYEKVITKNQTLFGQAFMNTSLSVGYSGALGNTSKIYLEPAFTLQYRYYYNYNRRENKGKRTAMNSLNYLSPVLETVFSKKAILSNSYFEDKPRAINKLGVVWGFQRNYKSRFSLDLNIGLSYLFSTAKTNDYYGNIVTKNINRVSTLSQLNLGFWLNKRK